VPRDPLAPHAATPADLQERLAAERRGSPFLVLRDGENRQRLVDLDAAGARLTIGRHASNQVALGWDGEVSRLHAELERIAADWVLTDDDLSRNGTFVNGERIRGRRRLHDGDVVTVGETHLAFVAPTRSSAAATKTAAHPGGPKPELTPAQHRVLEALCRPLADGGAPASNRAIADELVVAVDTVKGTLSRLFEAFGIGEDVPQNQKRALLARRARESGLVRD